MTNESLVANIDFGDFNLCSGVKELCFFNKEVMTEQDRPGIEVTTQYGPSTHRLVTGQDEPGIRVTVQDGPGTHRLIAGKKMN